MDTQLRLLRKNSKKTQKEAATEIGVRQSTISMWENGQSFPRHSILELIAKTYNCSIQDIFMKKTK